MFKRLMVPLVISVALIAGVILWWRSVSEPEQPKTSGLPMKVSRYYWPGQFWIEIADKKGWFSEAGLNVELVDTNPDYDGSLHDMVEGKLDTNNFTLFDLMRLRIAGADLVMVVHADDSLGAEALVARRDIKSIRELKGKSVGVDKDSYLGYFLETVLERNGLSPDDIRAVDMQGEKAAEAFIQGAVDAILTWEPVVTDALEKGNGRKLFDTSEIPGISPAGLVFHRRFIEERPEDVQAFVEVWHRTGDFIREHPKEAFSFIAEIYQIPPGEVQAFTHLDRIRGHRDNLTSFAYAAGFESLHGTARQMNNFMIEHGMTDQQLDSTDFIDGRFIRHLH